MHARPLAIGLLVVLAVGRPVTAAPPIVVGPTDGSCPGALFTSIQAALDAAPPRSQIVVCPGTYAEQVEITKAVRLSGRPGAQLAPVGLRALATSLRSGRPVAAVVTLRAPATIEGLAVEVAGHAITRCDGTEPLLAGIFIRGVAATVRATTVGGAVIGSADAACANGIGILAHGSATTPRVRLEGVTVERAQRAGISLTVASMRATVRENLVTGRADAGGPGQVGIEIDPGITAQVIGNVVRDHRGPLAPRCAPGTGLRIGGTRQRVGGNQAVGNDVGIHLLGRGHRLAGNSVDGGDTGFVGLWLDADASRIFDTIVRRHGGTGAFVTGHRNTVRRMSVESIQTAPACTTAACTALPGPCGVGIRLTGWANRLDGAVVTSADLPTLDQGRANVLR